VTVAQDPDQGLVLVAVRSGWDHVISQVAAVEAGDDCPLILEPELTRDVSAHVRRRRRGEGDDRRPAEALADLADPQIARPEVVPPLADAVRLVDGEQRDTEVAQPAAEGPEVEALRGNVKQLDLAALDATHPRRDLAAGERAVEKRRRDAAGDERVDLVLHQ
jgi:hypothetical protein